MSILSLNTGRTVTPLRHPWLSMAESPSFAGKALTMVSSVLSLAVRTDTEEDPISCVTWRTMESYWLLLNPMESALLVPAWRTCQRVLARRLSWQSRSSETLSKVGSNLSLCLKFLVDHHPSEVKPAMMKRLIVRSSDIPTEPASPVLSSSLPTSPCPVRGEVGNLDTVTTHSGAFCFLYTTVILNSN